MVEVVIFWGFMLFLYSLSFIKERYINIGNYKVKKLKKQLWVELLSGVIAFLLLATPLGLIPFGRSCGYILFMLCVWGMVKYGVDAIKDTEELEVDIKQELVKKAERVYFYIIPFTIIVLYLAIYTIY